MHRREFLRHSLVGAAAVLRPDARPLGANDDIRVAVIGLRGQGRVHIRNYAAMKGVRIVALCDCDREILNREASSLEKQGIKVAKSVDVRQLLEQKDIDAVSIVTPNHWHALGTIWACQAGKDVCVEKPVSHNIWEGRKMVEAARKYRRIVQADLDMRSERSHDQAIAFLRSGGFGKVLAIRIYNYKYRPSIGKTNGQGHIPDSVDYDLWCGPAKKGPIDRSELHYDWHWVWDTGGGEIANNGPHHLDLARWALAEKGLARRVMALGGRFGYADAGETPNTMIALFDYATAPVIFESRGLPATPGSNRMDEFRARTGRGEIGTRQKGGNQLSAIFQCEGGYIDIPGGTAFDYSGKVVREFDNAGSVDSQANFIRAVRSRRIEDIKTDIEEGHLSTSLCHMGNISYRLGAHANPAAVRERMQDDKDAAETLGRFEEHLAVHGVALGKTPAVLGPWLTMDPGKERFAGPLAEQANRLLGRQYRAPFVVPENV